MRTVIQIIGTTGVGKSQLSIELATRLNTEIINSDSMQVYRGLDIITNKHPLDQRAGIPHHLLGFLDGSAEYRIGTYERDASSIIDRLHEQGKVPIIVGGTAYYATSLLFKDMLPSSTEDETMGVDPEELDPRLEKETEALYADLQAIDPVMATRWHPRDHRKIRRSLQIFYTTGRRQSELYAAQRSEGRLGPQNVRYRTLFLWLYADQAVLDARLDARVDEMLRLGLLDEVRAMDRARGPDVDYTKGILQAIGYKEFAPFLRDGTEDSLREGIEATKAATRRYARKQVKWIRKKLLLQCREAGDDVQVVLLDATDLDGWRETVSRVAQDALEAFLADAGETPFQAARYLPARADLAGLLRPTLDTEFSSDPGAWQKRECPLCPGFSTNSAAGWREHLDSNAHHAKLKRARKRAEFEAWKARNGDGDKACATAS